MELFRVNYEKLTLDEDIIKFLAEYFDEHTTEENGIIAHIDDAAIEDMGGMVFKGFPETEQIKILDRLKGWWKFEFSGRERNEGIDIQILTGSV